MVISFVLMLIRVNRPMIIDALYLLCCVAHSSTAPRLRQTIIHLTARTVSSNSLFWGRSSKQYFIPDFSMQSLAKYLQLAMKTYWGSGGIPPRILDVGTRWRWVVSFMPRPLYSQGMRLRYPLDRSLGGSQGRSGRGGEEKNSQPPTGIEL
jgi:hypothetical protein